MKKYSALLTVFALLITLAPPAFASACTISGTLKLGAKGASVSCLQQYLAISPMDGNFGAKTKAAVEKFQTYQGLTVDGIV